MDGIFKKYIFDNARRPPAPSDFAILKDLFFFKNPSNKKNT